MAKLNDDVMESELVPSPSPPFFLLYDCRRIPLLLPVATGVTEAEEEPAAGTPLVVVAGFFFVVPAVVAEEAYIVNA